ncbi:unnamed protein product [Discula destructiva]
MARNWISVLLAVGLYGIGSSAQTEEPCAVVSSAYVAQIATAPAAIPTIAASIAYDCLLSVPLGKEAAIEFVDSAEPYLEWQSDAAYKANPPADYFYPAYDMFTSLATIRAKLGNDSYSGEYEFQDELYRTVFGAGHDGHFVLYPDLLTIPFDWNRPLSLVSISEDQSSLPEIKVYEDVISSPRTASVVTLIDGIDAATYLGERIYQGSWNEDADSAYNSMFYEISGVAAGLGVGYFQGSGRIRYIYQGATTNLTFANGTEVTLENYARIKQPFTGVTDGASMYEVFCDPNGYGSSAAAVDSTAVTLASDAAIPGYPTPVIVTNDSVVAGFYLDGAGYEDVAVIVLLAFESESPAEFQAVSQDFFNQARADGKTKLVIDFQGNGGGYILQGYDFFRQLFPSILPDGFSRWKDSDSFVAISQAVSDAVANIDPYTSSDEELIGYWESWFNYRYDLNITNQPFLTFDDKFGPVISEDTKYTEIMRWNLTDPLTTTNETYGLGIEISGFGTLSNLTQPFAAENIIMLYDGVCASTCTLASEMLRLQGGVRSIAMGGRPTAGPIQGVGGVKGAQVLDWSSVLAFNQWALANAPAGSLTAAQVGALSRYNDLAVNRSSAAAVNVRDQILRGNVEDGLPAQFVREEVDCRLYWTADMITDITAVWKAVADSAFHGAACAYGGIPAVERRMAVGGRPRKYTRPAQHARRSSEVKRAELPALSSEMRAKLMLKAIP